MIRYFLIIVILQLYAFSIAQTPLVVHNASKGVVLKSSVYGEIYPSMGTNLFEKDTFQLNDERYFVKIKEVKSGEIFTYKGKGLITPLQIVSKQRYDLFDKFRSFLCSIGDEMGFNTAPVRTSQCVIHKGGPQEQPLSISVASQINNAIFNNLYAAGVDIRKVYLQDDGTYYYSVQNSESVDYALVLYTVSKDGVVNSHNEILVYELGRPRPDKIAYIPLMHNFTLDLDFFSMDATEDEDNLTCYVLLFNPIDFYEKVYSDLEYNGEKYNFLLDWDSDSIKKELIYQGNVNRVIKVQK